MELPRTHEATHYRRKARRYAGTLRLLFGIRVDTPTIARWGDVIALGRGIDTYLDEVGDRHTLPARTKDIERLLDTPAEVGRQFPALALPRLGPETYSQLRRLSGIILSTNLAIKTTDDVHTYAHLRRREGRTYAGLITTVVTPAVAEQRGFAVFQNLLGPVGEITNLGNSFIGIHREHAHGELALQPNHLTRLKLAGHMAVTAAEATHEIITRD